MGTPGCDCDATNENAWRCVWCGKLHWTEVVNGKPLPAPMSAWCDDDCQSAHRKANPTAWFFDTTGWFDASETLPGGRHDGVWENSGFSIGGTTDAR